MNNSSVNLVRERIDHLNTLDKADLRRFYMQKVRGGNPSPDSKGAGLGLIEIARRSSDKIEYSFSPVDAEHTFFSICVKIGGQ